MVPLYPKRSAYAASCVITIVNHSRPFKSLGHTVLESIPINVGTEFDYMDKMYKVVGISDDTYHATAQVVYPICFLDQQESFLVTDVKEWIARSLGYN